MRSEISVTTLPELQIWIEGKFELALQSQKTTAEDVRQVRSRMHDLAGEIAKLSALNIEEKLLRLDESDRAHETTLEAFKKEAHERRGALYTLRLLYLFIGAIFGAAITVIGLLRGIV